MDLALGHGRRRVAESLSGTFLGAWISQTKRGQRARLSRSAVLTSVSFAYLSNGCQLECGS